MFTSFINTTMTIIHTFKHKSIVLLKFKTYNIVGFKGHCYISKVLLFIFKFIYKYIFNFNLLPHLPHLILSVLTFLILRYVVLHLQH